MKEKVSCSCGGHRAFYYLKLRWMRAEAMGSTCSWCSCCGGCYYRTKCEMVCECSATKSPEWSSNAQSTRKKSRKITKHRETLRPLSSSSWTSWWRQTKNGSLTITTQLQRIATLPVLTARATDQFGVTNSLAQTTMFATSAGQTALFAMFVRCIAQPVVFRVVADRRVSRIDTNDFVEFESRILGNPVRVQDAQWFGNTDANTWFGNSLQVSGRLQLVHTMIARFAGSASTVHLAFTTTTTHANAVDNETGLGLESKTTSLFRSTWARTTMHNVTLTVFPASQTQQEHHHVALLLTP